MLPHLILPAINFTILMVLLWALMKRPLRVFLATRREQFKRDVNSAQARRVAMEERLQESEERLLRLDDDQIRMRRSMEFQGRKESDAIIGAAEERAESMYLDAHRSVAREMAMLKRDMFNKGVMRAMGLAEEDVRRRIGGGEGGAVSKRALDLLEKNICANGL